MRISDWSSDVCSSDLIIDTDGLKPRVLLQLMSSLLQRRGGCIRFGGQAHIRTLLTLNNVDLQLAEIGRIEREGGAPRSGGYICDLPRHAIDPLPIHAHVGRLSAVVAAEPEIAEAVWAYLDALT